MKCQTLGQISEKRKYKDAYRDMGCNLSPKCLECPYPVCRHDIRNVKPASIKNIMRDLAVYESRRHGITIDQIADELRIHKRTVFRSLKSIRNAKRSMDLAV
jgi:hypothetical protein